MTVSVRRFDIVLADLNPAVGAEMQKIRPCIVVSPDAMNSGALGTVIIVPMTSSQKPYPTRVNFRSGGQLSSAAADQVRTISRQRIKRKLGKMPADAQRKLCAVLQEMFQFE